VNGTVAIVIERKEVEVEAEIAIAGEAVVVVVAVVTDVVVVTETETVAGNEIEAVATEAKIVENLEMIGIRVGIVANRRKRRRSALKLIQQRPMLIRS